MSEPVQVTRSVLRDWPLPPPGSSKDARGAILAVGGSDSVPGAMVLAGEASLRAGGGKLQVATTEGVARHMAVLVPEALVHRAPALPSGNIAPDAAEEIVSLAESAAAVLLGPGITRPEDAVALLGRVVPHLGGRAVVVDALGSAYVTENIDGLEHLDPPAVLTVNPSELALVLGADQDQVDEDPLRAARDLARRAGAVVLCGGEGKHVAAPDGRAWLVTAGCPGLGISGSGDVQAGLVAGLLARGASPVQAAVWGAWLHGRSGEVLAESVGPVGFLARELPAVVPGLLVEPSR